MFRRWFQSFTHRLRHRVLRRQLKALPAHLRRGRLGEEAARRHLESLGLRLLTANFATRRGEIDLICRAPDCLVFVEVKTRSREHWNRPAAAVHRRKQRRLSLTALEYLQKLRDPRVPFRFDIVEVLLEDELIREIRHLPNAFPLTHRDYYP